MKRFLLFAVAASLLLTACGGSHTCSDPLGCVTVERGQPLTIATLLTLSGLDSSYGIDILRGMEIAIQDQGNLLGREIQLEQQDDQCTAEGGEAAARTLAGMPQMIGIIGSACSDVTVTAAQILSEAGMVLISPATTAASLTSVGDHQPGFLRTIYNGKSQAKLVADFAFTALGTRRMVTIHDGTADSRELQQEVCSSFVQMGGQCLDQVQVESHGDLISALQHIASLNPDVLFYPLSAEDGAEVTAYSIKVGLSNTALIGSDRLLSTDFFKQAGRNAQGMYIAGPIVVGTETDFYQKYEERYGEKPVSAYAAQAYDAAMILFAAIEKVAIQRGSTIYIPRQALREALFATQNFRGASGEVTCSTLGDCGAPDLKIYQVHAKGFEPVYP